MVARLREAGSEHLERLNHALETLHNQSGRVSELARKISSSKTTWLVAGVVDGLDKHIPPPPLPAEYTVAATDGSHIDVDRHQAARCFLINIGAVTLHYGAEPDATLESIPRLYSDENDLVLLPPDGRGREQPIEGQLLGIKRSVEECQHLSRQVEKLTGPSPVLAILDGSLILWALEAYPDFVTEIMLGKVFLPCLDKLQGLNKGRKVALASYISFPRATDVVNALRVAVCPYEPVDCDRSCAQGKNKPCDVLADIRDRELYAQVLGVGERSPVFASRSSIVRKYYGGHSIYFFYLRLDDEIARVEFPQWVAEDEGRLGILHSLVLDQCRRGQGYPVALSEAHEQAVVTGLDRELFWQIVESSMVDEKLPVVGSAKNFSKRTRWV